MSRFLKSKRILSIFLVLIIVFSFSSSAIEQKGVVPPPALPITINPFYSTYSQTSDIYTNTYKGYFNNFIVFYDDGLQLRSNCYGYVTRMFFELTNFQAEHELTTYTDNNGNPCNFSVYKQEPGEFADKTNGLPLYDLSNQQTITLYGRTDLNNLSDNLFLPNGRYYNEDIDVKFNYIEQLVEADFAELGYTITEYTGSTIPSASSVSGKRMIALVVGNTGFHFYMQHGDDTWSHKTGRDAPRNTCLTCNNLALTNSNIRAHTCEGGYYGGVLKFYYITKNAIIDSSHLRGTYTLAEDGVECKKTVVEPIESGNIFYQSYELNNVPIGANRYNLDYVGDTDFFNFSVATNDVGTYTFAFQAIDTQLDLTIKLYDDTGYLLKTQLFSTGTGSFSYSLTGGSSYFLSIEETPSTTISEHTRNRRYSISITK